MKKYFLLLSFLVVLSGCFVVGSGKASGYITAVETGVFWNRVYVKTDIRSSQEKFYVIEKDNRDLYNRLEFFREKGEGVTIAFKNHLFLAVLTDDKEQVSGEVLMVSPNSAKEEKGKE